jgi:acyltransferase
MSLFFFLAGYIFSIQKYKNIVEFFERKFKSLIVPYTIFSLVNYLFWIAFRYVGAHAEERRDLSILNPLLGTFNVVRGYEWMPHNGTM